MEPMNAVALVKDGQCDLWVGTQGQSQDAQLAAAALGIDPKNVRIHTTFLGGGFGRRASSDSDFSVEAVQVANGIGKPVKVVWTREDDTRRGFYRPYSVTRVRAGIGADGLPVGLHSVIVGKPVLANTTMGKMLVNKEGLDPSSIEGAADIPYAIPNLRVEVHNTTEAVPNLWWRSVGHSINGFVSNGIVDELATLAGRDPYEYRRALLADKPRRWRQDITLALRCTRASTVSSPRWPRFRCRDGKYACTASVARSTADSRSTRTRWWRRCRAASSTDSRRRSPARSPSATARPCRAISTLIRCCG
jgi:isoquinoline 1-oxidoreductase beta subunit